MLNKGNIQDIFDLTPLQEGLLFHYLREEKDNYQNFEQICLNISGQLDTVLLERAWNVVVAGNDMLRTLFRWKKLNNPVQITLKQHELSIKVSDLCAYPAAVQEERFQEIKQQDKAERFDLEDVPFRVTVIKFSENRYTQIISNHSIIYDGWSNGILLKEFFTTYFALLDARAVQLFPKSKFKDFVRYLKNRPREGEKEFWRACFNGKSEKSELQLKSSSSGGLLSSSHFGMVIGEELVQHIKAFCRNEMVTEAVFFYTAWGILLQKVSNSNDVVFGTTVSGRSTGLKGVEEMVGLLINTLPLRVKGNDLSVKDLVQEVARNIKEREDFQHTPFRKIREYAGLSLQENLFDTIVLIENYPLDLDLFKTDDRCRIESFSFDQTNNFDIALSVLHFDHAIECHFGYNHHKYSDTVIQKLSRHFLHVISEMVAGPGKAVRRIEWVNEAEKEEIEVQFNETKAPYSSDKCIHHLFEAQCARHPHQIALVCGDQQLSYGFLNRQANRVAQSLRSRYGKGNVLVPVMMERSPELILVLMGILKAGYAYIPFEPSLPRARIQQILASLSASFIIDDTVAPDLFHADGAYIDAVEGNEHIAYIIYTSGSTGLPKGVAVQHKPVINVLEWMNRSFQIGMQDRLLFVTSLSFDLSVYDIFGSLAAGATVYIASRAEIGDPRALLQAIVREKITIWDSAPAAFQQVVQVGDILQQDMKGNCLRLAFLSGDWIGLKLPELAKKMFGAVNVVSLGGATEAVIWSNYFLFDRVEESWTSIPYGRPIQNAKYYILDEDLQVLPKGIIGDLYIGGDCLAAGYVNEVALTTQKFIPSPFVRGERIYKTGDMARFFEDGNIELIGRKDFQVKIRGFRVELGEIESQLLKYPGIKDLAVLVDQRPGGEKYIGVFYSGLPAAGAEALKAFLRENLPEYMIPAYFTQVETIPVTANGKVDRNALLRLIANQQEGVFVRPLSALEKRIVQIWSEILNYDADKIQVNTDFFLIGGHSLNATVLQARIEKEFDIRLPMRKIFHAAVLEDFARMILAASEKVITIEPAPVQDFYPVTSGQKRLYSLQLLNEDKTTYNISGCLKITGEPDKERMVAVVNEMIRNQDALRTFFTDAGNSLIQVIQPQLIFQLEEHRIRTDEYAEDDTGAFLENYIRPFDLAKAPLFRLSLIDAGAGIYYLLLDMHHIIADGISVNKFLADFVDGYAGKEILPPLLQYKDYAVWANSTAYRNELDVQEKYWLQVFAEGVPRLLLPLDYKRPAYPDFEGDAVCFRHSKDQLNQLQRLAQATDSTLFMVMLALYDVLLSKICFQADIVVGIPVVNRPQADLMNVIGFFVNTVVVKVTVDDTISIAEWVQQVKTSALQAFDNQEYPFEHLAAKVDAHRDPGVNPVFDVMLEFDNLDLPKPEMPGLQVEIMTDIVRRAKFDLVLVVRPDEEGITCKIEYATSLFNRCTIEWIRKSWERLVDLAQRECPIGELDIFEKKETINNDQIEFEL